MNGTREDASSGELSAGDVEALRKAIAAHPFTHGFSTASLEAMTRAAGRIEIGAGREAFRHGRPADTLYLVVEGDVALRVPNPAGPEMVLQTLHAGEALGWSWLYPPFRWQLDAIALTDVVALTLDAAALRRRMEDDDAFGRELAWRVGAIVVERLHHARAQLASVRLP